MKIKFKVAILAILAISTSTSAKSQVLISVLFGDKLNSEKIEFGLKGGFNQSYFSEPSEAEGLNNFNLGFYFHFQLKENSYLSTGVLVKSTLGARGMSTYPIGDADFDSVFIDGELIKKVHYFHVPLMWQQRFNQRWYLEGGFQVGLRSKAEDIFELEDSFGGDLNYESDTRDNYKRLDFGLVGGVGYKWKQLPKSVSSGINYYYGLTDISKEVGETYQNSSIYIYIKVPIGSGS
jgi:hypothetical protein